MHVELHLVLRSATQIVRDRAQALLTSRMLFAR